MIGQNRIGPNAWLMAALKGTVASQVLVLLGRWTVPQDETGIESSLVLIIQT